VILNKKFKPSQTIEEMVESFKYTTPETIERMINNTFRTVDIKRWLKQRQIYFGWYHSYNIYNPREVHDG